MDNCGVMHHEKIASDYVVNEIGLSARIGRLICAHVNAKRYLCWKDPEYHNKLSDASKTTLTFQGGVMETAEAEEWEKDPDFENFLAMRRWDEAAKDPNATPPGLESYITKIYELIR
jgi:predicted HD phosphohydrolase